MPLTNIIDRRESPYRWREVEAIVEGAAHDNSIEGADQADWYSDDQWLGYEEETGVSVAAAIAWADSFPYAVTLYLYDIGTNVGVEHESNKPPTDLRQEAAR